MRSGCRSKLSRYQTVGQVVWSVLVAGLVVVLALALAPPAIAASAEAADFGSIDAYLRSELEDARIPGASIAVVHGDQVVHLQGFGAVDASGRAVTPQTPFVIGSVTKSFTALAVLQLAEHGDLDLDAPVQRYLPWFRVADPEASVRITPRQLLNQTSGLPTIVGTDPLREAPTTLEAQVRALSSVELTSQPGTTYAYCNANFNTLGMVVQSVSGEPYADYLTRHILAPLQMRHSFPDLADATHDGLADAHVFWFGLPVAGPPFFRDDFLPSGFLSASSEDMAHYAVAQLNEGRFGDTTVLSPSGIAELHRPAVSMGAVGGSSYAMGWVVGSIDGGADLIWHDGSTTDMHAAILLEPRERFGVVLLTNATGVPYEMIAKQDHIAAGVMRLLRADQPRGTLEGFYIVFDVLVIVLLLLQVRGLAGAVRGRARGSIAGQLGRRRVPRLGVPGCVGVLWAGYWYLVLPIAITIALPKLLDAPWLALARTDLGLWAAVFATLQLAIGAVKVTRWVRVHIALPEQFAAREG